MERGRSAIWLRPGWAIAIAIVLALTASACRSAAPEEGDDGGEGPATVEQTDGSDVATITLTEDAARRIDLRTTAVRAVGGHLVIPYSAVLYDPEGETWTYMSPEHLVFYRAPIAVDRIVGNRAILTSGPPPGTDVVSVGQSELLGSEYEVEGE